MPTGAGYGRHPFPSGFDHLELMGPRESQTNYFFYPFTWRDVTFLFEDFKGGGLLEAGVADFNEGNFASGASNTGSVDIIATQLVGGVAQAAPGAFIADTVGIWGEDLWLGDQNAGCEFRYKIDDVDNQNFEVGFTDPLTDEKLVAIADIDTPSVENGAADVALVARQTGQTLKSLAFVTDGSTANMNTTATSLGSRNHVNAVYEGTRVQLSDDAAQGFIIDANSAITELAAHGALIGSRIEGGTLVHPGLRVEALANSAILVDIDYIAVWQDRS